MHYYNDHDPGACAWLRELIADGIIPNGVVDERSITEVKSSELVGFTQCHFFAGIGGWAYALRLAGWPDDRPVWTGSCPCQPFSAAGKQRGTADERHLWPVFAELIRECRPKTVFGEQVASASVVGRMAKTRSILSAGVSPAKQSEGFSEAREISRSEEGDSLRSGRTPWGDTGQDPEWILRGQRSPVSAGWRENLGQSFIGQDRFIEGVRHRQCQGGLPRGEQCAWGLGRGKIDSDCQSYLIEKNPSLKRFIDANWRELEKASLGAWLDGIRVDLEREGYAVGASVLPACCVGAPHIRQRLYWVADARHQHAGRDPGSSEAKGGRGSVGGCGPCGVGHAEVIGRPGRQDGEDGGRGQQSLGHTGEADWVGDADNEGSQGRGRAELRECSNQRSVGTHGDSGFWSRFDIAQCRDGKARRVPTEPAFFPLVDGVQPGRVGLLRGAGNAIVPEVAATFVRAAMPFIS